MIRAGSRGARRILAVTVLGSGLVFLDGTVVNIALPAIDADLAAGLSGLQWTVDAYLVTLTALLLLGGSLGDRYGHGLATDRDLAKWAGCDAHARLKHPGMGGGSSP